MPNLDQMEVFVAVVDEGSFVGAARRLGMPTSTVSRRIVQLEDRLGARLIHRTTRRTRVTDVGRAFFDRAEQVISAAREAEASVVASQISPQGLLRVTAPTLFTQLHLHKVVLTFLDMYPDVSVELLGTNRRVDLVAEGFDVAIRASTFAEDSSLIVRKLQYAHLIACASPEYIANHGSLAHPDELANHAIIAGWGGPTWRFEGVAGTVDVLTHPTLRTNDGLLVAEAALQGRGVCRLPMFVIAESLQSGALVPVLEAWQSPAAWLAAVYPSRQHLSPRVRAFLDLLTATFATPEKSSG